MKGLTMQAYSQTITKKEFVAELKKHQKADNFKKGGYWDGEKGCAVGCSLKSIDTVKNLGLKQFNMHKDYETHLGIPEWLARVEDGLFEGMSLKKSKTWPVKFAEADWDRFVRRTDDMSDFHWRRDAPVNWKPKRLTIDLITLLFKFY
jgi:hypothetical protein